LEDGTAIGEVLAIWRYFEEVYPTPSLLGSTPKDRALVTMWERRTELDQRFSSTLGIWIVMTSKTSVPGRTSRLRQGGEQE
jgi:glutathione S-transferase